MARKPKTSAETVTAICELLPDDPEQAANLVTVACAAVAISAGHDDDTAVSGLRAALDSLRDNGFAEEVH